MAKPMKQSQKNPQAETTAPAPEGETEGARRATVVSPSGAGVAAPPVDPEVEVPPIRRRFTAAYKLRMVEQVDRCTAPGEIGALLRKEGLYSSHLTLWRRQRDEGALTKLAPQKRGRKAVPVDPSARRVAELERENERLRNNLKQATTIIEIQKKVSSLLGIPLHSTKTSEKS